MFSSFSNMADDGSASNPRDPVKSSGWNVSVQRRRQQAVMVSKKIRKLLIWAKRQCKVGTNDADEMMIDEEKPILEAHTNIAAEELKSTVQYDHLPKELEITSSMASSSSSGSRRYDVFPSFSGEDVRKSFLSHFLKELDRRLINTFIDHGIERSRPIAPELLLAIRESRIAIVVFSKKYASSTWCLNELVEIHKCYKEFGQTVIPVFYNVDPSEVRKQTGEFGKVFNKTCKGKPEDQKQRWMQALTDVANLAGEDLHNWRDEAAMIEKITNDVFDKLFTPSDFSGDFVGIEAHLEAITKMLFLESEEVIMIGIVGPSGIGKTTIGRALFSQLSSQFHHRAFVTYKRTTRDDYGMRLYWQKQFLSDILCQKNIKIDKLGVMEQMLKHTKVFIVLDDVDDLELLRTLVGQTAWFGPKSRIIVISQDRRLLKAHQIHPIYEVEFPSEDLALEMLCRSAFGQNSPPDGFMELAVEVARLAGNLPLGLSVLGSSLRGMSKDEWIEMLPRLRNDLDGNIEKTLKVSYDRLDRKDQDLFLYIAFACLCNQYMGVSWIKRLLGDSVNIGLKMLADKSLITPYETVEMHNLLQKLGRKDQYLFLYIAFACLCMPMEVSRIKDLLGDSVNIGLKMLADKSLIRWYNDGIGYITMHNLLQKLGRKIVRAESINYPGKRRYLVDVEDIRDVFTDKTGTETVQGIYLPRSGGINEPLFIDENSFQGMHNLQFLIVSSALDILSEGITYLPRKLRLIDWYEYPFKCLPSTFKAEFLVELRMVNSKLEKLWEGTQPLRSLKWMDMRGSRYLKEIPDLSYAINLEELNLRGCESLVTLPSSIQNAIKLRMLDMENCTKLESLPPLLNLKSLESLNLKGCFRLRNFPQVNCWYDGTPLPHGNEIEVEDCLWNNNLHGVDFLDCLRRCVPHQFRTEHIEDLTVRDSMIEKLWEGVQSLEILSEMDLSECGNLKEFPDLSEATNLEFLKLNNCKSLVTVPSTIGNLNNLIWLEMKECTGLEVLPTDVNLSSLDTLDLSGCKRLRSFPLISWSIETLHLDDTAIEEVPSTIGNLNKLRTLEMKKCTGLEVLPTDVNLSSLITLDLSGCKRLRRFPQISMRIEYLILNDTAIEEVPCCIENFSELTALSMRGCKMLKNISPNIFRLRDLNIADFSECVELVTTLGDASVVETTEDYSSLPDHLLTEYFTEDGKYGRYGFMFNNCFNLDGDARELILRSYFRPTILPGGNLPNYFTHGSSINSLTVSLPENSLSQKLLGFKACVLLEPITNPNDDAAFLEISWKFGDGWQSTYLYMKLIYNMDHLALVPLKLRNIAPPYELDYNNVEFEFSDDDYESSPYVEFEFSIVNSKFEPSQFQRIKGCGIRVLEMSPSPASCD